MRKGVKKCLIAAVAVTAAAAIGVSFAFMFRKARTVNTFTKAVVSCSVHEKLDGTEVEDNSAVGSEKSDIRVKNTGNVKAYLRVRIVSYFANAQGEASGSEASVYPELSLNAGWVKGDEYTYYYTLPVEPGEYTPVMCEPFELSKNTTYDGEILYQVVQVFAEACQSEPDSVVREAWGVTVTDKTITAVP